MSEPIADAATIRGLTLRLLKLKPRDSKQIALLGFMIGVIYSQAIV
jgi:hypothetical protein